MRETWTISLVRIRPITRPLFRVGNRWKTSTTRQTTTTKPPPKPSPKPSSPSLFSRPTKIIRRKYLPQTTKTVESQETTTSTTARPKLENRFRFVSRKPILRTTTPRKKIAEAIFDQVSESSNQQSLEEDFEGGKTTELGELAIALQNIQQAPLPTTNSSSTLKLPITNHRTNSKVANRLLNKIMKSPPQTTQRIVEKKPTRSRIKYSTTVSPILLTTGHPITKNKRQRPEAFQKISSTNTDSFKPLSEYDYYDSIEGSVLGKIPEHSKVLLHSNGVIECLDQGNFPHPVSCKKFISCAKMENGKVLGWEYTCPKNLSFDPIGGICNWSAGLGCNEQ